MLIDSFQKQLHIASANLTLEMAGADDPMYDLVIKNGQIVDGTGNTSFQGDIGIKDGLVAKVANAHQGETITDTAKETIDAAGAIVSPGWVDTHSHMDGQATWDPYCSPANHHGITTLVMGNCGIGFAPCKPNQAAHQQLIEVVEDVEDIPGTALAEGIDAGGVGFTTSKIELHKTRNSSDPVVYCRP